MRRTFDRRAARADLWPRPPAAAPLARVAAGCGRSNHLDARGQVRCKHCGYRIFYKIRTDRLTQFEAR